MQIRIARQPQTSLAELQIRTLSIVPAVVKKADCEMDQSLEEVPLGRLDLEPVLLQGFVGQEVVALLEKAEPLLEIRRAAGILACLFPELGRRRYDAPPCADRSLPDGGGLDRRRMISRQTGSPRATDLSDSTSLG